MPLHLRYAKPAKFKLSKSVKIYCICFIRKLHSPTRRRSTAKTSIYHDVDAFDAIQHTVWSNNARRSKLDLNSLLRLPAAVAPLDALEDVGELLDERLVAVGDADVGHVRAPDVVARHALARVVRTQPVLLHLHIKSACFNKAFRKMRMC